MKRARHRLTLCRAAIKRLHLSRNDILVVRLAEVEGCTDIDKLRKIFHDFAVPVMFIDHDTELSTIRRRR